MEFESYLQKKVIKVAKELSRHILRKMLKTKLNYWPKSRSLYAIVSSVDNLSSKLRYCAWVIEYFVAISVSEFKGPHP